MGNEFGAADMQPHLVYGNTVVFKLDATGTTEQTVLLAGYHQKMRLREAFMMVVDAALSVADVAVDVKHGGNDAVAAAASGAVDSAVGTFTEMTIVNQYADLSPNEALTVKNDTASTTGDVALFLTYELVE